MKIVNNRRRKVWMDILQSWWQFEFVTYVLHTSIGTYLIRGTKYFAEFESFTRNEKDINVKETSQRNTKHF